MDKHQTINGFGYIQQSACESNMSLDYGIFHDGGIMTGIGV